jgi:hypothetical protein
MICTICGLSISSIEKVLEEDWILYFFEGQEEHGPVCPSCSDLLIYIAHDGVYELKKEFKGKIIYNDQLESLDLDNDPFDDVVLGFILN